MCWRLKQLCHKLRVLCKSETCTQFDNISQEADMYAKKQVSNVDWRPAVTLWREFYQDQGNSNDKWEKFNKLSSNKQLVYRIPPKEDFCLASKLKLHRSYWKIWRKRLPVSTHWSSSTTGRWIITWFTLETWMKSLKPVNSKGQRTVLVNTTASLLYLHALQVEHV